jgi:hypothetical protein
MTDDRIREIFRNLPSENREGWVVAFGQAVATEAYEHAAVERRASDGGIHLRPAECYRRTGAAGEGERVMEFDFGAMFLGAAMGAFVGSFGYRLWRNRRESAQK